MQAARVAIRNFRGIRAASLDLSKFHVLVGENGSGKTSVLEAIRLATTPAFAPGIRYSTGSSRVMVLTGIETSPLLASVID